MLPNNSTCIETKKKQIKSFQTENDDFEKVVKFIQWSEQENQLLFKFEHVLSKLIKITKDQLNILIAPLKIDHQLTKYLARTAEQIDQNLSLFFQFSFDEYQSRIESKGLAKVNLLMKTSSEETKCVCYTIIFLHFASSNMSQYNKIIHWWEKKQLEKKLELYKQERSCIIKQKALTIISILYIKHNNISSKSQLVEVAIKEREQYLKFEEQYYRHRSYRNNRKQSLFLINNLDLSNASSSKISSEVNSVKRAKSQEQINVYNSVTNYLRVKLIEALIYELNQTKSGVSKPLQMNCLKEKSTYPQLMKLYYVQTLINKFVNEVRNKNNDIQSSLSYFFHKMKQLEHICLQNIKHMELNVTDTYCFDYNQKTQPFYPLNNNKIISPHRQQTKSRILSLNVKHRSLTKSKITDQLNEIFFKNNNKLEKDRSKTKSAKVLVRQRSKSKIMAKILSNTFENAKNALRKIEFEIKTNNCDRIDSKSTKMDKQKLKKRRKTKNQIYEMFSQNKRILSNICKQKLLEQLKQMATIQINNPLKTIEDNKKCIIEHKIIHKDYQQSQLFQDLNKNSDQSFLRSQVWQKLKFIKIIEGIPHEVDIKIKPKDKNYVLKFYFKPFDEQQFTIEISLPKSNNVYTKRSQTIWPTIKYLLRKKLVQYPIFRQNQSKLYDLKALNQQEKNHSIITEPKLVGLFGPINEDQFNEICITLSLLCKFFYMLLSSQLSISGRRYQFCLMNSDLEQKKNYNAIKSEQVHQVTSFSEIKQLIWMNNRDKVLLGTNIVKKRGGRINVFEGFLGQPYYIFSQFINISKIIKKRVPSEVIFYIKVFFMGKPSAQIQINKKKSKKNPSFVYQTQINLSAFEAEKYNIDYQKLISNVKKSIFGYRMDKSIREKLQQLCWRYFQKAKQFYLPSYFLNSFPQISVPEMNNNIFSQTIETEIQRFTQDWRQHEYKIKICQNVLEFSLDQMQTKSISIQNYQQKIINQIQCTRTWQNKRKVSKILNIKKRIEPKMLFQQFQLRMYEQLKTEKKLSNKSNHINYFLRYFDGKYQKILVQVKFLTPFYPIYNWISEISMIEINSKKKEKIRFSAFDLYSLGFPILQSPLQTLKQIQKLSKCLKVNRNCFIHKLIFAINQGEPINTSIEKLSKVNHFCIDDSSYDKENRQTLYKFTSIYPNRKNKKAPYHDKPYFQTSGSLSDHKTQIFAQLNKNYNKEKNVSKQQNLSKVSTTSIQNQYTNFFLRRLQQYQWYLWTLPYKFSAKDQKKKKFKFFSMISLKYIHLQSEKKSNYGGIVQIEVKFSQAEYSLIAQLKQRVFYNTVSSIIPNIEELLKKIKLINRIDYQHSVQQISKEKQHKNKGRRFSTKNKQKNRLQKINFALLNCQTSHYTERSFRTELNQNKIEQRQTSVLTLSDKQNLKTLIKRFSIKKNTNLDADTSQNFYHSKCSLDVSNLLQDCSQYILKIQNSYFPMKIKLMREYDPIKMCIYDVYMHSKNWQVGTEFHSGIGLGAQIEIQRIDEEDHFQIVKLENRKEQNLKQIMCEEIQNEKILDLIKQYKLDQVDTICQMQPEFYTKTTILLIELAEYFFNNYVKKAKKSKKIQV